MKCRILFIIYFLTTQTIFAANKGISLIRDTEIENYLYEISKPIFISAGLNPEDINFYIVDDDSINAFVMGGQNIFVNTGTLTNFSTPDATLGIIAHETGHIAAGHLANASEKFSNMGAVSIGSILLGIGAMLTGIPELGQAIIYGSMHVQQQAALKYTRGQEENADDLAVKYLNNSNLSAKALLVSMNQFYFDELNYSNTMEYYSTHPLSRHRKAFIENKIKNEKIEDDGFNKNYQDKYNFIRAKILAYKNAKNIFKIFSEDSDYAKYANSIINMNNHKISEALKDANYLINKHKTNPYFYELKGDIYFKDNKINEALKNYKMANELLKDNTLIKKSIAFIIIKYKRKEMYKYAIDNLNYVVQKDKKDSSALKLLAEAYYHNGEKSMSYLTLSQYYINQNDRNSALNYVNLAEKNTNDEKILKKIEDFKASIRN